MSFLIPAAYADAAAPAALERTAQVPPRQVEEDGERHVRVVESGSPAGIRLDDPSEDAGRVIDRIS